jgi:SM-20-related protein
LIKPASFATFHPLVVGEYFTSSTCGRIVAELRTAQGGAAPVYVQDVTGTVNQRMRNATLLQVSSETAEMVKQRLHESLKEIAEHFHVDLTECEEPQFLRYDVGGFFVAHQDGNTPLMRLDRDRLRKISVIVLLNRCSAQPEPESYCGGSLIFSGQSLNYAREEVQQSTAAGTLIAFRSETTHEVTPVTAGERFSIVSWYR